MSNSKIIIAPSIISADFSCLGEDVERIEKAGADAIHVDIMDGHFVPNLTIGPGVLCAIRKKTKLFLDVHLMMYNPYDYVENFVRSGASSITFHSEATESIMETIEFIRTCNCKVGLAFNPDTSVEFIPQFLPHVDQILLMSVKPGFSGQAFIPDSLEKIARVKEMIDSYQEFSKETRRVRLQVDGGIDEKTAKEAIKAGADSLVSGSFLLKQKDLKAAINSLKS
jgi:ribulose-phosphate 3-epimerase